MTKMLSLKKRGGDATHVCDIVHGRQRLVPVYYYHDVDDKLISKTDDYAALLQKSLPDIKDRLRINQKTVLSALALLQSNKEPDEDETGEIRRAYYFLKKRAKELLREELDFRDVPDRAEINIPTDIDVWPGTMFVAGSSGSGKGYFVCSMILRHWRRATPRNRRHVWYISPELRQDVTLRMISDVSKYEDWFHGIDVSHDTFDQSGLSSQDFFNKNIKGLLEHQRHAILVFDDFQDAGGELPGLIRKYVDRKLRVGRHDGLSTWSLQHSLRNSAFSRQAVQSCKHVVLFARSQRGKVTQFLKDSVGLSLGQSRELTKLMSDSGRHGVLRMHAPMMLITDKYVKLL